MCQSTSPELWRVASGGPRAWLTGAAEGAGRSPAPSAAAGPCLLQRRERVVPRARVPELPDAGDVLRLDVGFLGPLIRDRDGFADEFPVDLRPCFAAGLFAHDLRRGFHRGVDVGVVDETPVGVGAVLGDQVAVEGYVQHRLGV